MSSLRMATRKSSRNSVCECKLDSILIGPIFPFDFDGILCLQFVSYHSPYQRIREVHKRRYQLQSIAMEVFLVDGTNCFLVLTQPRQRDASFQQMMARDLTTDLPGMNCEHMHSSIQLDLPFTAVS